MISTDSVWSRRGTGADEISPTMYNAVIGGVLMWGFAVNYIIVTQVPTSTVMAIPHLAFIIGYFVSMIAGTWIYSASDNPIVSFGGYNLIVLPLGIFMARFLPFVDPAVIGQAFQITAGIVIIMTVASTLKPALFLRMGSVLFIAFIAVTIDEK